MTKSQRKPRPNRDELLSRALSLLTVDTETGVCHWAVSQGRLAKAGDIAGSLHRSGYWFVRVEGHNIRRSHIVFYAATGRAHEDHEQIDHVDMCRHNDAASNLRAVSQGENFRNRDVHGNSTTRVKGVARNGDGYQPHIRIGGRFVRLGTFASPFVAWLKRAGTAMREHGFALVRESTPTNFPATEHASNVERDNARHAQWMVAVQKALDANDVAKVERLIGEPPTLEN